jgi:hypothetical protein
MLAAGTPERLLADRTRFPDFWTNFKPALCAIHIQRYEEASELLRNAPLYAGARDLSDGLKSDPEAVRQQLAES